MKISNQEIMYMNALGQIAKVSAKDCLIRDNEVIFIVGNTQLGKAIGKNGSTIKKLREKIGKNVELFEEGKDAQSFFSKAFFKTTIEESNIKENSDKRILEVKVDGESKKKILQNKGRLNKIRELLKRNYNIDNITIR